MYAFSLGLEFWSVKYSNFDLMYCIYFCRFVFDEFITKWVENAHKVVELFD
jgi:hypothetical protein